MLYYTASSWLKLLHRPINLVGSFITDCNLNILVFVCPEYKSFYPSYLFYFILLPLLKLLKFLKTDNLGVLFVFIMIRFDGNYIFVLKTAIKHKTYVVGVAQTLNDMTYIIAYSFDNVFFMMINILNL